MQKLKLGNITVYEKEFNALVTLYAPQENAVDEVLREYALTREDVTPMEIEYIKARLFDVRRNRTGVVNTEYMKTITKPLYK